MRIGILTYHSSHNYGAFLQAFALCNSLRLETGNNVEIINYSMVKGDEHNRQLAKKDPNSHRITQFRIERYQMFEEASLRYHSLSGERFSTDDITEFAEWIKGRYDTIIVGSDEIWKVDGFRGFPTPYWLPGITGCRKISYAASARTDPSAISLESKEKIREYLSSFDYIGVRDNSTKKLVESLISRKALVQLNCDPTFTYNFHTSKERGRELIKRKFGVTGKKCIALMLNRPELANCIIKTYQNEFDFIELYDYHGKSKGHAVLDPFEWIEAIAGVDGLITNFFHGTVFALKNNTPFISIEVRGIKNVEYSKMYDLLHRYGLDSHFYMIGNPLEQTLREIGDFLADVVSGKAESDFRYICEAEKKKFSSFLTLFPDLRKKYISITHKAECCGCKSCESVCPTKSIRMEKDEEGFWYPSVDQGTCINCGLCNKVCTFDSDWGGIKDQVSKGPIDVYGVKHKNENIRMASRSGGVFTALSDRVLSSGGSVYGVILTPDFLAKHKRAVTKQVRDQFRGSKYIQSDMDEVFSQIRTDLQNGKTVLFSGTPCQVSALRKNLEYDDCDNLILVDIICHGVPSPKVWRDYLDYLERKYKGAIESVDFRNKKFGWASHRETFTIKGKEYDSDVFTKLFYSHLILRPCCYECKYKCVQRTGDLTIADYWGIDKAIPGFNDNKGVSLVLVNTEKGRTLFKEIKKDVIWREARLEDSMQNSLRFCYQEPAGREEFWREYQRTGIAGYLKKIDYNKKKEQTFAIVRKGMRFTKRVLRYIRRSFI